MPTKARCPSCGRIAMSLGSGMFKCMDCGGEFSGSADAEYPGKTHICSICHLPTNSPQRELIDINANKRKFYAHDPCYELIRKENELDTQQFDEEIEWYKIAMTMPCPECHSPDIILVPIDNDKGEWVCTNCGVIFNSDQTNKEIAKSLTKPLKCLRCGQEYTLDMGHQCELRVDYLEGT